MDSSTRKANGAYYTPDIAVRSLVRWAVHSHGDRMLDPACGDGRFLSSHPNSVGVEYDAVACATAQHASPDSLMHQGDFFTWASNTHERFECAAGNPPFIRYQRFAGAVRNTALALCALHGARFSGLTSSWAPFLVATATLLKPGGRMAFVVPAEIGHAPYARPLLEYLAAHFGNVHIIAIREKLFPNLSEDCWLLYAEEFGRRTDHLRFSALGSFAFTVHPPQSYLRVSMDEWRAWNGRLRPFLLPPAARDAYLHLANDASSLRLGDVSAVGIGYVTGANDFFHLRPSDAEHRGIPHELLRPAVRNSRSLTGRAVTRSTVEQWCQRDEPVLLLDLKRCADLPSSVRRYLNTPEGHAARATYKCRTRSPWYAVPDVSVPDAFLSYMSGSSPALVTNSARCVGTNSVHLVKLKGQVSVDALQSFWGGSVTSLSCELEGHPLGGGMLKLEPTEAARVVLHVGTLRDSLETQLLDEATATMRQWRHHA